MIGASQIIQQKQLTTRQKMAFLRYLAHLRGFHSLTELAKACGVGYQHLYKVVAGERESRRLESKLIALLGPEAAHLFPLQTSVKKGREAATTAPAEKTRRES